MNYNRDKIRSIGLSGGAAQPIINKTTFSNVTVSVPDLPSQERIASILSAYDDLIENNRRRIALLEQAARLLYREWFVHFRFPGHETAKFVDGLPEGWESAVLSDLVELRKEAVKPEQFRSDDVHIGLEHIPRPIARANRVKEGKENGLIVDYCGILKNLRKALATFAGHSGETPLGGETAPEVDPLNPEEKLLEELAEAITIVREGLSNDGFDLVRMQSAAGFEKLKFLKEAKELINANDETRKRFEISARAVFRKYKSCLTFQTVESYKVDYQAIHFIYVSLQEDKQAADTAAIVQRLNEIVSAAINIKKDVEAERIFDISKVNFELLRKEFAKSERKASDVQDLRTVIQKRLAKMLLENPSLGDFQERFDEIVVEYNKEKDKNTIEATFEALMRLTAEMEEEAQSHVALGLTPEQKPVFDLLMQDDLTKEEIRQIKKASVGLLQAIRKRIEEVQDVFSKQGTRDGLRQEIYDLLYDERTGLPTSKYDDLMLRQKTNSIFNFFENRLKVDISVASAQSNWPN